MIDAARVAREARWLGYALIALAVFVGVVAYQRLEHSIASEAVPWAYALFLLCAWPSWRYLTQLREDPHESEPLPLLAVIGAIYAVYFAVPALVVDRPTFMSATPTARSLVLAQQLATIGWAAALVGYYGLGRLGRGGGGPRFELHGERTKDLLVPMLAIGLLAEVCLRFDVVPSALRQPVVLVTWLHPIAVGIAFLLVLRGRITGLLKSFVLFAAVPSLFALRLGEFGIRALVFSLLYLMFLLWSVRRSLPWMLVAVALVGLGLLKGSFSQYRRVFVASGAENLGQVERMRLLSDVVVEHLESGGVAHSIEGAALTARDRTAMIALFAHVIDRTPGVVPHWGGSSYRTLPESLIPRVLWPDKPPKRMGQEFGHTYGLLVPWDTETLIHCPQVVELYVNFGVLGVPLGMLLFGWFYSVLVRWVTAHARDDGMLVVGSLFFSYVCYIEADTSFVYGLCLQAGIVLYFAFRFLGAREGRRPGAAA